MDTSFVPLGENRLRLILNGLVAEGDKAESVALEAKGDIDVSRKGIGVAKVAKFILGAANRLPDDALRHFQGFAVMVLGVEEGQAPGVCSGVEAHELGDRLRPYLGPNSPKWDLARLPAGADREVLFVVVDPPKPGDPPYPCHKDFQPQNKQDSKHALQDGALYVRDKSNTRTAKAMEVLALLQRGSSQTTPEVEVKLICGGSAVTLHDAPDDLQTVIRTEAQGYRKERAESDSGESPRQSLDSESRAPVLRRNGAERSPKAR